MSKPLTVDPGGVQLLLPLLDHLAADNALPHSLFCKPIPGLQTCGGSICRQPTGGTLIPHEGLVIVELSGAREDWRTIRQHYAPLNLTGIPTKVPD